MLDFDALEAAGIGNARGRAGLIEYLENLGFTAEEMVEAEARGRLFGLAGDALQASDRPMYTLAAAAGMLGVAIEELAHAWDALGLTVADARQPALSRDDVDGLAVWVAVKATVGDDAALQFLRVLGASMARLAEAGGTMIRCGIGFADMTGFTALTQQLTPDELAELLLEFGGIVADLVHADGGRVVKFIGDEVMWVSSTAERLAKVAVDLVELPLAREAGLLVRAGLGHGRVLAIAGDYFGTPVNLAARLVAAAAPGQILASTDVRDELPDRPAIPQDPLILKGFDSPVVAYDLHLSR